MQAKIEVDAVKAFYVNVQANVKSKNERPAKGSVVNTEEVVNDVKGALSTYHVLAVRLQWLITVLGVLAIGSSLAITAFAGILSPLAIKILSFVSTFIFTIFAAFNILGKHNDIRKAWRHLNHAYLKYNAQLVELLDLIDAKNEAEFILGYIDFNSSFLKSK